MRPSALSGVAGANLGSQLVGEIDDTGIEGLRVHELQGHLLVPLRKEALAAAGDDRVDQEAQLIEQAVAQQRPHQGAAAGDGEVLPLRARLPVVLKRALSAARAQCRGIGCRVSWQRIGLVPRSTPCRWSRLVHNDEEGAATSPLRITHADHPFGRSRHDRRPTHSYQGRLGRARSHLRRSAPSAMRRRSITFARLGSSQG